MPGPGRYLLEWAVDATGKVAATAAAEAQAALTAQEPDLPQGWAPSYHAPLVSEFNGSVSLDYPILTPPGAAGLQPNLGLSYSSANGNGMMGRLQADETGFGWNNTALIDITQAIKTCHGTAVCPALGGDADDNPATTDPYRQFTLSFNGVGYELVHQNGPAANGAPGRYYARGQAGLYIELCQTPFSLYCRFSGMDPQTQSAVFWRVKGPDNTTYRLGYTTNSEQEILDPTRTADDLDLYALRWRVDTVTDRFGNTMGYTYVEDAYTGWVHPEYFHAPASYLATIVYDAYTVEFTHTSLPYGIYERTGYAVSTHTRYLSLIRVKITAGGQQIRHYSLGFDYQRYGVDNDTDDPPQDPPLAPPLGYQSTWCGVYNYVLTFNDPADPDDNTAYAPDKLPVLLSIHEGGSDQSVKALNAPDATFRYIFLGTGQYDHPQATSHVRYCFPYLATVETLYGPAGDATPTTAYTWRDATSANPPQQSYGDASGSVLGRYVNVVEQETTYSGFTGDAPTRNVTFRYTTPNMQGDKDTFQGFNIVDRCEGAACTGAWERKETLTFWTKPYTNVDAALTGRLRQSDVRAYPDTLVARTEDAWAMLDADGNSGTDLARVAVLTQTIRRNYRGATIASRTDYEYDAYGNTTETQEYGERTGTTPWRTLERKFTPNTAANSDKWLVNLAWRETLWDGLPNDSDATKIVSRTRFRYDAATCADPSQPPTDGLLKAEDQYLKTGGNSTCGAEWLTTTYTYHPTRRWQVTRVTDPAERYKDFTWTDATRLGSVSVTVGTTSYVTAYTYDAVFRWQVKDVTQPNGAKTRYTYDVHGRLDQVKAPDPVTAGAVVTVKDYNYLDTANPFYVDEVSVAMGNATTRTFYDAVGRPLQVRRYNVSDDFNTAVTDTEYDAFGRAVCQTAAIASASQAFGATLDCQAQPRRTFVYDVLDEQVSAMEYDRVTTTTTSIAGRERRVVVAGDTANPVIYESDELGRLVEVTQPTGSAPTMTYTYDLADRLLTATGPNNAGTELTYDKLGRKVQTDDPDMGIWTYAYDGSNNLVRQTDAKGQLLCFYYDAANRLTYKTAETASCPPSPGVSILASYLYGIGGTEKGLVESISTGSGVPSVGRVTDSFIYDRRGRVTFQTRSIGGVAYTLGTAYDNADRPLVTTLPGGEQVTVAYNGEFPWTLSGTEALVTNATYNHRGQLTLIDHDWFTPSHVPDTTLTYYTQTENFRLDEIQHGTATDAIPNFLYNQYDERGNLEIVQMKQSGTTETQTYGYDPLSRLTSAVGTGTAAYNHTYSYGAGGNLATRVNRTPAPDLTRTYSYGTPAQHHAHAVAGISGDGMTGSFVYDANGNMTTRTVNGTVYTQAFDKENRLSAVTVNGQTTSFYYDASGNRILTVLPNNTKVYTPFPEYEESITSGGVSTQRSHYYFAGQLIAARVRTGSTGNGTLSFAYADHLGNIAAWTNTGTSLVPNSLARYEPFGGYRTKPASGVNPDISDRGFTGHRQNNTGTYDLGLIYMNARYYLPEIGRFISADTIVPDPKTPQAFNRYSYSLNSPTNLTDPSGHCTDNYEAGSEELGTCIQAWNAVVNYLVGATFGPGGSGQFPNEVVSQWLASADISTLEKLMASYGIGYGYTYSMPPAYTASPLPAGSKDLKSPEARAGLCQYWEGCYDPVSDYSAIGGNFPIIVPFGLTFIWDDWGNVYISVTAAPVAGVSVYAGNARVREDGKSKNVEDLAVDRQEKAVEEFLTGWGDGGCAAMVMGGCITGNPTADYALQFGFASPGINPYMSYTWLIYDN